MTGASLQRHVQGVGAVWGERPAWQYARTCVRGSAFGTLDFTRLLQMRWECGVLAVVLLVLRRPRLSQGLGRWLGLCSVCSGVPAVAPGTSAGAAGGHGYQG